MSTEYSAKIVESNREFSARERIMMKDFTNAEQLDTLLDTEGKVTIEPADYAILEVHNSKSKDKQDYRKIVIIDGNGNKYITGSESFIKSFVDIMSEMDDEAFAIEAYKVPSKNYAGKSFLTCSII